jgi:hypothetical protein
MNCNLFLKIGLIVIINFKIINCINAQQTPSCKVLLKEISGTYNGTCKNGLADGSGIASGEETYIGSFKNGLPDGKGVYKHKNGSVYSGNWKNGLKEGEGELKYIINGKDSIITGTWKKGKFLGQSNKKEDFKIINQSNIQYYSIKKVSENGNTVEVTFEQNMRKYLPADLNFKTSSGFVTNENIN